jgi:hypothetical protein
MLKRIVGRTIVHLMLAAQTTISIAMDQIGEGCLR